MEPNRENRALNEEEEQELAEWLDLGIEIMAYYGVDEDLSIFDNLDNVYEAWVEDGGGDKPLPVEIVSGLGAAFGDRLCEKYDGSWEMRSQDDELDYVVLVKNREIHPFHFVAKRVAVQDSEERESGFFAGMESVISDFD